MEELIVPYSHSILFAWMSGHKIEKKNCEWDVSDENIKDAIARKLFEMSWKGKVSNKSCYWLVLITR